ncbi:hypothetical protein PSACC_01541 [Paramicrosporidium saccamoebae]|uniref:Uncharacterized protein n=1 Tax=Paramicrosporidium saccamoebae TaxID=1246581 RepID=A0A2H9TLM6_9FUNG|nr:hypothetical protein PSACC_01541 [Paramicrosporidium saccamoebae]
MINDNYIITLHLDHIVGIWRLHSPHFWDEKDTHPIYPPHLEPGVLLQTQHGTKCSVTEVYQRLVLGLYHIVQLLMPK